MVQKRLDILNCIRMARECDGETDRTVISNSAVSRRALKISPATLSVNCLMYYDVHTVYVSYYSY